MTSVRSLNLIFPMAALLLFGGCGTQPSHQAVSSPLAGISGQVHGGQQPIAGATIQLYTVGTGGDGSASTPLLTATVTTDANGNFNLAGLYSCTSATQVYLTATGGNAGASQSNPNIALMVALGPCSSLASIPFVQINELTTVAGVSALAPYMTSLSAIGSGTSDAAALATAFELSSEFVDFSTGTSPGSNVPSGLSVPVLEINTLGDIVATCVNSVGGAAGDNSSCGNLFSLTTPPNFTAPTNTIAALLNLANNPTLNTNSLYALVPSTAPFQPTMSAAPPDFRIRLMPTPGSGTTVLQITPLSIAFPSAVIGVPSTAQPVTITNTGSTSVTISAIAITGVNAADFSQTNNCGSSLASAASCTVQVTATPSASGTRNAYLGITSSSPDSPQYVALSVTGTTLNAGPITISPSTLSFIYDGSSQDVTLSNFGTTPLVISSITSSNTTSFVPTSNCGTSLPAQSVCTISVQSIQLSQGTSFTGTLTVNDNAASGPQTVALTSSSVVTAEPVSFGTWAIGNTITDPFYFGLGYYTSGTYTGTILPGLNASDFSVSPSSCTAPLQSGGCSLQVTFTPSAVGPRSAKLGLSDGSYALLTGTAIGAGPSLLLNGFPWPTGVLTYGAVLDRYGNASGTGSFILTNNGSTTLSFPSIPVSGAYASEFAPTNNCPNMAPQSTCTLNFTFNGTAPPGLQTATFSFNDSNSSFTQKLQLGEQVTYLQPYTVPSNLSFASQAPGTISATQTFSVEDRYSNPLGHPITVALQASSSFTLPGGSTCPASTTQLCTLSVAFAPQGLGAVNETLTVTDLTSGDTTTLSLAGTAGAPTVSLSPSSLTFPTRSSGTTSIPMSVTLTNTGTANLTISSISIPGAVNGNFTQTNNCLSTIAVTGTCTINVTFAPTTTGSQTAAVQILSNAASSPDSVSLSGTAN